MCTGTVRGARLGLLLSSIFLMIISMACLGGGIVLVMGRSVYGSELKWLQDELTGSSKSLGVSNLDVSKLDVIFITLPLGAVLILFGLLMLVISILGTIAASGQFYKFVIVYLVLISCLFFTQTVVIICAYIDRTPFDSTVKNLLKYTLEGYAGDTGTDGLTLGWNAVMSYKKCCGVDSYGDFAVSTAWTPKTLGGETLVTPGICCIVKVNPPACANNVKYSTDTYHNRGCYQHIWDHVTSNTGLIIFTVFFIVLLEFLCIFFSCWILCGVCSRGASKVDPYRYN
ncbi:unnamed protein product [Lymnaea stagnalis]|uniref:Tetraspanin n=1 Tax=Lymnaea stagnalis TaxID=6523 RepID=A0AAV2H6J1_LYMST